MQGSVEPAYKGASSHVRKTLPETIEKTAKRKEHEDKRRTLAHIGRSPSASTRRFTPPRHQGRERRLTGKLSVLWQLQNVSKDGWLPFRSNCAPKTK